MKNKIAPTGVAGIALGSLLAASSALNPNYTANRAFADARELQEFLPAVEASLALISLKNDGGKAIDPVNAPTLPDTPADMWQAPYLDGDTARFPADPDTYIEDFYGEEENRALMELREVADS